MKPNPSLGLPDCDGSPLTISSLCCPPGKSKSCTSAKNSRCQNGKSYSILVIIVCKYSRLRSDASLTAEGVEYKVAKAKKVNRKKYLGKRKRRGRKLRNRQGNGNSGVADNLNATTPSSSQGTSSTSDDAEDSMGIKGKEQDTDVKSSGREPRQGIVFHYAE